MKIAKKKIITKAIISDNIQILVIYMTFLLTIVIYLVKKV